MSRVVLGAATTVLALNGVGCTSSSRPAVADVRHHYFDESGTALAQWDFIWDGLSAYFDAATPDRIVVRHKSGGSTSQFDPQTDSILLTSATEDSVEVAAHESTHLCMFHLTHGASDTTQFRFFDEGFANIMGYEIAGDGALYQQAALQVAAISNQQGNVSFAQVQDWSTYFGDPESSAGANWNAYDVGASFDYMIRDNKGEQALHDFFADIGITQDLGQTFTRLFSATEADIEQEWLAYLANVTVDQSAPTVVEMSPSNDAAAVPVATTELSVKFNVAMQHQVCISTPCGDTGVCYTNAYWKDLDVLAVKVDGALKAGYQYYLTLGSEAHGCPLKSYAGVPLPYIDWSFTAGD